MVLNHLFHKETVLIHLHSQALRDPLGLIFTYLQYRRFFTYYSFVLIAYNLSWHLLSNLLPYALDKKQNQINQYVCVLLVDKSWLIVYFVEMFFYLINVVI